MLPCLICTGPFQPEEDVARSEIIKRKPIFPLFCKLLGIPDQTIPTFSEDVDFQKEIPFCKNCIHLPINLAEHTESRDKLEETVLELQMDICDKLRQMEQSSNEIHKILRQVRRSVKNPKQSRRSKNQQMEVNLLNKLQPLRTLIIEMTPVPEELPKAKRTDLVYKKRKSERSARVKKYKLNELKDCYPQNFVTRNDIPLVVDVDKVEIKDEPLDIKVELIDIDNCLQATFNEDRGYLAPVAPIVGESVDFNESSNESLGIYPEVETVTSFCPEDYGIAKTELITNVEPQLKDDAKNNARIRIRKHTVRSDEVEEELEEQDDCSSSESEDDIWTEKELDEHKNESKTRYPHKTKNPVLKNTNKCRTDYLEIMLTSENGDLTYNGIKVIQREDGSLQCSNCGQILFPKCSTPISLQRVNVKMRKHIQEKHLGGYQCKICSNEPFQELQKYASHMKRHSNAPTKCEICNKPFKLAGKGLFAHMWNHKNDLEKKQAMEAGIKPPPIKNRSKDKKHLCPHCGKCFLTPKDLKEHEEIHRDQSDRDKDRVACHVCGNMVYPHQINKHLRLYHNGRRQPKYSCETCLKKFERPSILSSHIRRVHTGEKPFSCGICSKKFAESRLLKVHLMSHSEERPFPCQICSTKFKLSTAFKLSKHLKRHIKNCHGVTGN